MDKKAQLQSVWPQIYRHLKNPRPGINLGSFPGKLPPINKIIIDQSKLPDNPNAIGYVSTEDVDNNGVLDTIHIASPRLEEAMRQVGLNFNEFKNLDQLSNEQLIKILTPFVDLISHEMGHIKDYQHGNENPFPGGESVAENAAKTNVNSISLATNISIENIKRSSSMKNNILKKIANFANKMDKKNYTEIADHLDAILNKLAQSAENINYNDVFNKGEQGTSVDKLDYDFRQKLKDMREGGAEKLNYDFQAKTQKMLNDFKKEKGAIAPLGDPYTYNFDAGSKVFSVASTPEGKEQYIGRLIGPQNKNYPYLLNEARKVGLVPEREQALQARSEGEFDKILSQLGFDSNQKVTPEMIDPFIEKYQKEFHLGMSYIADRISATIVDINPAVKSALESSLKYLKNPNITGQQALNIYSKNIDHILIMNISPENASRLIEEFKSKYALWQNVEKLLKLKSSLGSQNMADDELLADKNATDYSQIFWNTSTQPFGRSNSKFTRT